MLSSATTRKKLCQPLCASVVRVADGLTVASCALEYVGSAAAVAPEKAGPTTASTLLLDTNCVAMPGENVGDPWSSFGENLSLNGSLPNVVPALAWLIASATANFMFRPSWATPPDSGPS